MKKITYIFIALMVTVFAKAQNKTLINFDKVELNNINGLVEIELGKPYNVQIEGLPANDSLITINVLDENRLVIALKKNLAWDKMQQLNLKIKIAMPEISKLYNNSNANIGLDNFIGRYLSIKNSGNGNVVLKGTTVDILDIENNGNGDTNAKKIEAKKVTIIKSGNGNIEINTNEPFTAKLAGNGDIVNFGKGKAIVVSQSGNGDIIYRN